MRAPLFASTLFLALRALSCSGGLNSVIKTPTPLTASTSGYVIVARNFADQEGAACDRGLKHQTISYTFAVQVDGTWEIGRHDLRPGAAGKTAC